MEHPEVAELMARGHAGLDNLTPHEEQMFVAWNLREVFHMQNVMQLHKNGLLNKVDYDTWLAFTAAQLKTPGGRESWERQKITITPTIRETIDAYMHNNPGVDSLIDLFPEVYGPEAVAKLNAKAAAIRG